MFKKKKYFKKTGRQKDEKSTDPVVYSANG